MSEQNSSGQGNMLMPMDELRQLVQTNAFGIQSISQQMGIIQQEQKNQRAFNDEVRVYMRDNEDWKKHREESDRIDEGQRKDLYSAVHARARELLNISLDKYGRISEDCREDAKKYLSRMIGRIWTAAKRNAHVANQYVDTKIRDYDEAMRYISTYMPPEGIKCFKDYVDVG